MSESAGASIKAIKGTLRYGSPVDPAAARQGSLTGTLVGVAPEKITWVDLDETVAASSLAEAGSAARPASSLMTTASGRTTVLPRRKKSADVNGDGERPRFDRVRLLGEGGMGQVELARDNDIRRTVAVKRLHAEAMSEEAVLRFADEVRIVGQLEHPAIVPVYDVGRDETGQVYLVMKHLSGETMEQIIDKLRAKDPAYQAEYSVEHRVQLFFGVLDAIRYAHARGILHRDLKPANVMVGPYGEVTVLDWGIAKPIRAAVNAPGDVQPLERTGVDTQDKRLQETQLGALAGTPLYMSPEQAAGRNDELDERSDVYSLSVLLYEWLSLDHPLKDKKTVTEVLAAIISGETPPKKLGERAVFSGVPAEWVNVIIKGLVREREGRFQSVAEFENCLRDVLDGRVKVECHVTLSKRLTYELLGWMDRHPMAYFLIFHLALVGLLVGLGFAGYRAVRAFF